MNATPPLSAVALAASQLVEELQEPVATTSAHTLNDVSMDSIQPPQEPHAQPSNHEEEQPALSDEHAKLLASLGSNQAQELLSALESVVSVKSDQGQTDLPLSASPPPPGPPPPVLDSISKDMDAAAPAGQAEQLFLASESAPPEGGLYPEGSNGDGAAGPIQAYAKLEFPGFSYYIQTLDVSIGRRPAHIPDPTANGASQAHITGGPKAVGDVDVDLGPLKSISRLHARIFWHAAFHPAPHGWAQFGAIDPRQGQGSFVLQVFGRNGAFVDDVFVGKDDGLMLLSKRTKVQIAERVFYFVLPPAAHVAPESSSSDSLAGDETSGGLTSDESEIGSTISLTPEGEQPSDSSELSSAQESDGASAEHERHSASGSLPAQKRPRLVLRKKVRRTSRDEGASTSAAGAAEVRSGKRAGKGKSAGKLPGKHVWPGKGKQAVRNEYTDEEDDEEELAFDEDDDVEPDERISIELPIALAKEGALMSGKSTSAKTKKAIQQQQPKNISPTKPKKPGIVQKWMTGAGIAGRKRKRGEPLEEEDALRIGTPIGIEALDAERRAAAAKKKGKAAAEARASSSGTVTPSAAVKLEDETTPAPMPDLSPATAKATSPTPEQDQVIPNGGGKGGKGAKALKTKATAEAPGAPNAKKAKTAASSSAPAPVNAAVTEEGAAPSTSNATPTLAPQGTPGFAVVRPTPAAATPGSRPVGRPLGSRASGPSQARGSASSPPFVSAATAYAEALAAANLASQNTKPGDRPELTNAQLLRLALGCDEAQARGGKSTLQEVYDYMTSRWVWYKNNARGQGKDWKSSIRHAISSSKEFTRIPRKADEPGKGIFYALTSHPVAQQYLREQEAELAALAAAAPPALTGAVPSTSAATGATLPAGGYPATGASYMAAQAGVQPQASGAVLPLQGRPIGSRPFGAPQIRPGAPPMGSTIGRPPGAASPPMMRPATAQVGRPPTLAQPGAARPPVAGGAARPPGARIAARVPIIIGTPPASAKPPAQAAGPMAGSIDALFGGPPIVHHDGKLYLSPQVFGRLPQGEVARIANLGVQEALKVLQGHLVSHLQERMRGGGVRPPPGAARPASAPGPGRPPGPARPLAPGQQPYRPVAGQPARPLAPGTRPLAPGQQSARPLTQAQPVRPGQGVRPGTAGPLPRPPVVGQARPVTAGVARPAAAGVARPFAPRPVGRPPLNPQARPLAPGQPRPPVTAGARPPGVPVARPITATGVRLMQARPATGVVPRPAAAAPNGIAAAPGQIRPPMQARPLVPGAVRPATAGVARPIIPGVGVARPPTLSRPLAAAGSPPPVRPVARPASAGQAQHTPGQIALMALAKKVSPSPGAASPPPPAVRPMQGTVKPPGAAAVRPFPSAASPRPPIAGAVRPAASGSPPAVALQRPPPSPATPSTAPVRPVVRPPVATSASPPPVAPAPIASPAPSPSPPPPPPGNSTAS